MKLIKLNKSEFDWKVKQLEYDMYEIVRFEPKFNTILELRVQDGKISGTYVRPGLHFDWEINGTYDKNENVNLRLMDL